MIKMPASPYQKHIPKLSKDTSRVFQAAINILECYGLTQGDDFMVQIRESKITRVRHGCWVCVELFVSNDDLKDIQRAELAAKLKESGANDDDCVDRCQKESGLYDADY